MANQRLRGVVHGTQFDFYRECQNNARGKYPASVQLYYNGEKVTTKVTENTITFSTPGKLGGLCITFTLEEE